MLVPSVSVSPQPEDVRHKTSRDPRLVANPVRSRRGLDVLIQTIADH